jgi:hypothetical protein
MNETVITLKANLKGLVFRMDLPSETQAAISGRSAEHTLLDNKDKLTADGIVYFDNLPGKDFNIELIHWTYKDEVVVSLSSDLEAVKKLFAFDLADVIAAYKAEVDVRVAKIEKEKEDAKRANFKNMWYNRIKWTGVPGLLFKVPTEEEYMKGCTYCVEAFDSKDTELEHSIADIRETSVGSGYSSTRKYKVEYHWDYRKVADKDTKLFSKFDNMIKDIREVQERYVAKATAKNEAKSKAIQLQDYLTLALGRRVNLTESTRSSGHGYGRRNNYTYDVKEYTTQLANGHTVFLNPEEEHDKDYKKTGKIILNIGFGNMTIEKVVEILKVVEA